MGSLKQLFEAGDHEGLQWASRPAHHSLLQLSNKQDVNTELPGIWEQNVKINMKWLIENKDRVIGSTWDLPKHEKTAGIIIGGSPILKRQWKELKEADDRFVKIAVNSSAQFLVEHGIIPDYVVYIDGKTSPNWSLDLGKAGENIILLTSLFANPKILQAWSGKIIIIPHKVGSCPEEMKKLKRRWKAKYIPSGGNAFNSAIMTLMLCTEVKIFLLAGNELSWKKQYYAHGNTGLDAEHHYFATDVKGRKVRTHVALYNYKVWLEHLVALSYPQYVFFNCSEGLLGVDVDGGWLDYIYQRGLKEAIELTKGALHFEELPWEERNRLIYEDAYQNRDYHPTHSGNLWPILMEEIPFEKALDVGCGEAQGIKTARDAGKDAWGVDIADLTNLWKKQGVQQYCNIAPAHRLPYKDNEFDMILCSEVMEHIPLEGIDDSLREIYRVGSDKFVFTIAMSPDIQQKTTGIGYHVTIQDKEWWFNRLETVGFHIGFWGISIVPESIVVVAVKNKDIYIGKEKSLWIKNEVFTAELKEAGGCLK